jgi:hypothetical protein
LRLKRNKLSVRQGVRLVLQSGWITRIPTERSTSDLDWI